MMRRVLRLLLLIAVLAIPGLAKPGPLLVQTHVNLTLSCQDLAAASQRLQALTVEFGGMVTNANLQLESGSGSANLRIPPDKLQAFLAKAHGLGDVQSENMSVSDNTRAWEDARANLELAEHMATVEWQPKGNLTPQQRLMFEAEFKTYLRDRINSTRSSLANYEDYKRWAEISVTLQGQGRRKVTVVEEQVLTPPPAATPVEASGPVRGPVWLVLPSVFLGVCLAYFMFLRRPGAPGKQQNP